MRMSGLASPSNLAERIKAWALVESASRMGMKAFMVLRMRKVIKLHKDGSDVLK